MPAREAAVWQVENGKWVCSSRNVNHRITHNGDFDSWRIFGQQIDNAQLGWWLERVLHTPNATSGDSQKISGMMDLLITQGMWNASLRLAYQLELAESIEETFGGQEPAKDAPNTAPSQQALSQWAEIFERVWQKHNDVKLLSNKEYLSCFKDQVFKAISQNISLGEWSREKQVAFVSAAADAFLHNDLYRATQIFMSRARGSFGLVTVSTLAAESLVLSSQGQPISIGFNLPEKYMVYASEPAAVDAVLANTPDSYRLDLDQKVGEIALVGANSIVVYSMTEERELLEPELEKRWMPMQGNPYIQLPRSETKDPVASGIQEIPQVLKAIEASWKDPASFNRQSAEHLVDLFIEKVNFSEEKREKMLKAGLASELGHSPTVDFLITGIENSLWLGKRFAQDLKTIFPLLNVKTLSANQVLSQLQHDSQSLHLGKDSLVLAISQSGQTFATLQATNTFDQLYRLGVIGELFILTGELNSLMGAAIGQSYFRGAVFSRRIFTNGSGRRYAEPATVAVAAAQATLTELLFYIAKRMQQAFPDSSPFGMTLTPKSLSILETIKADFLKQRVASIVGTTANGFAIRFSENQKLISSGRKWALHITEAPLAWGIHALYILIVLGWAIPFGHTISLTQTIFRSILLAFHLPSHSLLLTLVNPVLALADIGIAIFGPWLWTLCLRCVQGRQLLGRTGKRTLVIGDVPWVNQLLKSYVSKLFSLSYGIASLEVHGANPQDHLLHDFGHRVVRGTLFFLGVPDGRRSQRQKNAQDAAIMTGKQVDGVRNIGVGPEMIAIGHDPDLDYKGFDDAIVLRSKADSLLEGDRSLVEQTVIEELRESRFSSFERLLAGYVLFWALAKKVASFPFLRYQHWKSQSRTKIATTAAPVLGMSLVPKVGDSASGKCETNGKVIPF